MKTIPALLMTFFALLAGSAAGQVPPSGANERAGDSASRPNILVILADDMGYGDTGFNGCKDIPTPAIDSIARNGVRFSAGHATAPQCALLRCGLLSGRYQNDFGCEVNNDLDNRGIPVGLRLSGDYLHPAGYRTGIMGKWHLGESPECHPNKRGFDEFFGFVTGGHIYYCDQLLATPPPEKRVYYKLLERTVCRRKPPAISPRCWVVSAPTSSIAKKISRGFCMHPSMHRTPLCRPRRNC